MRIDFVDAVKGTEKKVKIESGEVTINIPRGVRNGTELRFPGKGMEGPDGTPNGDLFITLRVPTPKGFERAGDDLGVITEISFVQAVLGDNIEVDVVDPESNDGLGKATLKVPKGTQPGTQFRLRDKGMPRLRGNGRGSVIVKVNVKIPTRLNRRQKKLMEDYQKTL